MYINHTNRTIVITKSENKEASRIGSEMDKEITAQLVRFPSYTVEVVKDSKKKGDTLSRINYDFIEAYIKANNNEELLKVFYAKRGCDENGNRIEGLECLDFTTIKSWFLDNFKELVEYNNKIQQMKEDQKNARREAKIAKQTEQMKKLIAVRAQIENDQLVA